MTVSLPDVAYTAGEPELIRTVSTSKAGNRAIAFVEYGDPFWRAVMTTFSLSRAERLAVKAFLDTVGSGMVTVLCVPPFPRVPGAYVGDPDNVALSNDGNLVSVTGKVLVIDSVTNGLTIGEGDLISLATGDYRSLHRVAVGGGGTASDNAITLTVEPFVPSYIEAGAIVKFKSPEINMRMLPGSGQLGDEWAPVASFTLVEVPK